MRNKFALLPLFLVLIPLAFWLGLKTSDNGPEKAVYAAGSKEKFDYLSQSGNSSCSTEFTNSILQMPEGETLKGSCCSQMVFKRYEEQVEGLKKYSNISEIPPDPYDISADLAEKLVGHYDNELTADQQKAYEFAMENSHEKGPCCCKCWRWYVYGGLGKYLIQNYGFTGEQVTEVWNLSDGCGGSGDHT